MLSEKLKQQKALLRHLRQMQGSEPVTPRPNTAMFQRQLSQLFGSFSQMKTDFKKLRSKGAKNDYNPSTRCFKITKHFRE